MRLPFFCEVGWRRRVVLQHLCPGCFCGRLFYDSCSFLYSSLQSSPFLTCGDTTSISSPGGNICPSFTVCHSFVGTKSPNSWRVMFLSFEKNLGCITKGTTRGKLEFAEPHSFALEPILVNSGLHSVAMRLGNHAQHGVSPYHCRRVTK